MINTLLNMGTNLTSYRDSQNSKIKQYFDEKAEGWDDQRRYNSYYKRKLADLFAQIIPSSESIAEMGCGTGDLLSRFKSKVLNGFDLSEKMIEKAHIKYP